MTILVLILLLGLAVLILAGVFVQPPNSARWALLAIGGAVFLGALLAMLKIIPVG